MTVQGAAQEYREWLAGFLPADYVERQADYRTDHALRAAHQRAAFEEGWLIPSWPRGLGGRGLDPFETIAVKLEGARSQAPRLPSIQSVGVIAPAIRQFGTEAQIDQLLVPTLRGDLTWALGMSEPDAGSDLAALSTRATSVDGGFHITGQKIWTTQAHTSDWAMLYCRTDRDAPRHKGISCLLLDLPGPGGVTVREIETGWPGTDEFCEMFFDETFVGDEWLLGDLDGGWKVAMSALNHERDMIWINAYVDVERVLRSTRRYASGALADHIAVELGRLATDAAALHHTGMRALASEVAGRPNPEFSILKLLGTEAVQRACDLALSVAGAEGLADDELLLEDFDALGATIFGGTSEIQRNIIGERVLGLPRG
jgi:alkylation response protein AidB-like acyl-CoA dehydrogenase